MPDLNTPQPIADGSDRGTRHAIVIGGGVAGLLAARVVADHFERVTVLDRDNLPDAAEPRHGAPQGRHIHALWAGGANVIEELFPGILHELTGSGALALDACRDLRWFHHGVWKLQTPSAIVMHAQSRPFLEHHLRRRVAAHPRVTILQQSVVRELSFDPARMRVTGVRVEHRGSAHKPFGAEELAADLVLDASGRWSKTPQWLEAMGFDKPPETTVGIDLGYASRLFHVPADAPRDWKALLVFAKAPGSKRYGIVAQIEGQRWIVTLSGCLGDHPPADHDGFMAFARQLDRPELYEAIERAEPASGIATYRIPTQMRRHYERLPRFPDGLVVMGDALCSFNPVYGQGMTVCALQAKLLAELLQSESPRAANACAGLPRQFFKRAKKIIDNPWLLATCSDFLYPATEGYRPFGTKLLGWYIVQLLELAEFNETIVTRFHEVLHFLKSPTALFHPYIMLQAVTWGLGWRRKPRRPSVS
jgi:2-polyprenyl-6-methoxyphenol hydroxylase-like FAD-dependent oxidoreductase